MGVTVITEDIVIRESQGGILLCLNSQGFIPGPQTAVAGKLKAFDDLLIGVQVVLDVGQRRLKKMEIQELRSAVGAGASPEKTDQRGKECRPNR